MNLKRRFFLKGIGGAFLLSLTDLQALLANQSNTITINNTPVNIIIPREFDPLKRFSESDYQFRLTHATLSALEENFSDRVMPVWGKYFNEVNLEKRITNIIFWIRDAIEANRKIYPVDPVWILAQIMKESYFNEFAVSRSLAVGVCQFILRTAKAHDMLCAGERQEHFSYPYQMPELAGKAREYYQIRDARRKYRGNKRPLKQFTLEETLQIIYSGKKDNYRKEAGEYLSYLDKLKDYEKQMRQVQENYRTYLLANVEGKDIFNGRDLQFILSFDERFTYKKPILAMVEMMARGLRARNGNILAATIGYNAGLNSTIDDGMYKPYGKIPAIEETTTYLSHVLINHYEISRRI
jgi:predicted transcriptional regulator